MSDTDVAAVNAAELEQLEEAHGGLSSPSFLGLLATQTLTAINDNIFRWLVIGVAKDYVPPSQIAFILMAGTVCFVAPYLVLAAAAGYLADRFPKRQVIVGCKVAEVIIMALGCAAIMFGDTAATERSMTFVFIVVALMGAQSALFSPSKLGAIPELLKSSKISAANGLFGLATIAATVIGTGVGSWLADYTGPQGTNPDTWWMSPVVLLSIAVVGLLCSFFIRSVPAANPTRKFPWDFPMQTFRDLRFLWNRRALFRVALGITFFWSIGALANLNIDQFAAEGGALTETAKNPLLISLVLGIGVGSVLAGVCSGGRVELGMLPIGAFGVALFSLLLFTVPQEMIVPHVVTGALVWACFLLLMLGTSAGLFSVPLESYLQHRSPRDHRGSVLAAANFLVFTGVVISSVLFAAMRAPSEEGSLSSIPKDQRGLPLAEEQQAKVTEIVADFEAAWEKAGDASAPPDPAEFIARADSDSRNEVITQLAWADAKARQQYDAILPQTQFLERFSEEDYPLAKEAYVQAGKQPLLTAKQIFLVSGALSVPVLIYILFLIPQATVRFVVWLFSLLVYRIRVHGQENIPEEGGALLVPNHVSWLDGILLLLVSPRPIRMVVFAGNFKEGGWIRWLADQWRAIMIGNRPKEIVRALKTAREAVENGELVCIFAEGGITRSGQTQGFRPGMMKILQPGHRVIPVYLDELWGSIFSYEGGKFFWKKPRKWPYPISIYFGKPLETTPTGTHEVRQAVQNLGATAVEQHIQRKELITRTFIRRCKQRGKEQKVVDSLGGKLTGTELLQRTVVLRRLLARHVLAKDEKYVGVLLPPSAPGVVVNAALALDKRVSANLNYTVSNDVMNNCIEQAGIKHVLTSKRFFDKLCEREPLDLNAEVVFLEDLKDKPTTGDKIAAGLQTVMPAGMVEKLHGLHKVDRNDVATIIFTSGSTGTPKGVMLTYANIASNVEAVETVVHLTSEDILMGVLPFFHSFGYTITMWGVMGLDIKGVYHFNPLDGKSVAKLCEKYGVTLLLATPTFLRTYLRRAEKEQFAKLEVVVAGAERLPPELSDAFEEKFGVRPVEGYGATELSPLVSVNVPKSRSHNNFQDDAREGSVGRTIPGVTGKITDLDSGEELDVGESGMLWIKGPNVMAGYLNRDDLTSEVLQDGWYKTGDVAFIDADGFITITGRQSRFSKIGGEMVPHIKIEEALNLAIGGDEEEGLKAAVTSVSDEKKGEALVVLHTKLEQSTDQLCEALTAAGLPNLYIPSKKRFFEIEEMPILGSGKLDLKRLKAMAEELC